MYTLRCTGKLLKRMKATPVPSPPPSTTVLGDWYANIFQFGRTPLLIAVSEKSLLPVLLPARNVAQLPELLPGAVEEVCAFLEYPFDAVRAEISAMREGATVSKTASRRVLGSMNDFISLSHAYLESHNLRNTALKLSQAPCSPIDRKSPRDVARALLSQTAPPSG